jgi:small-conductance mechanosensitive channel
MSSTDDFNELLAEATLPERTVRLCLRGDLTGALEQAERELAQAEATPQTGLSDDRGVPRLRDRVEELRTQVQDKARDFKLRGITSRQWSDLVAKNPPREDTPGDRYLGYNPDGLFDELVALCLVDPALSPEQVTQLADHISAGQWDLLTDTALTVSRRKVDVPFSPGASDSTPDSAER